MNFICLPWQVSKEPYLGCQPTEGESWVQPSHIIAIQSPPPNDNVGCQVIVTKGSSMVAIHTTLSIEQMLVRCEGET